MHGYVVQDWCRFTLLLSVQQMFSGSKTSHLTLLIMNYLMTQDGLKEKELATRLVCFRADRANTFQGLRSRVIIQIQR